MRFWSRTPEDEDIVSPILYDTTNWDENHNRQTTRKGRKPRAQINNAKSKRHWDDWLQTKADYSRVKMETRDTAWSVLRSYYTGHLFVDGGNPNSSCTKQERRRVGIRTQHCCSTTFSDFPLQQPPNYPHRPLQHRMDMDRFWCSAPWAVLPALKARRSEREGIYASTIPGGISR